MTIFAKFSKSNPLVFNTPWGDSTSAVGVEQLEWCPYQNVTVPALDGRIDRQNYACWHAIKMSTEAMDVSRFIDFTAVHFVICLADIVVDRIIWHMLAVPILHHLCSVLLVLRQVVISCASWCPNVIWYVTCHCGSSHHIFTWCSHDCTVHVEWFESSMFLAVQ